MFEIKTNGKIERERERVNGDQKLENKNPFNFGQKIFFMCLLVFIFGLGFGAKAQAATYYMRADGTAVDKVSSTSCNNSSTAMSVATHNSQTFLPGDIINLCDTGGIYRSGGNGINPPSSGSVDNPIVYQPASGQSPVLNGANLLTGPWINDGGNLWHMSFTGGGVTRLAWFDGTKGTLKASSGEVTSVHDWYYDNTSHVIYVYSTADPQVAYTSPGIEIVTQSWGIYIHSKDYITVKNISLTHQLFAVYSVGSNGILIDGNAITKTAGGVVIDGGSNVEIKNNDISYSYFMPAGEDGAGINMSVHDSPNFSIHNNTVTDTEGYGIGLASAIIGGGNIYSNTIARCGTSGASPEPFGIAVRYNTNVYQNEVSYCGNSYYGTPAGSTAGIQVYGNGNKVYKNKVHNNNAIGIMALGVNTNVEINQNLVYDNSSNGISLYDNGTSTRSLCLNNTIYHNCVSTGTANLYLYNLDYTDVKNNIIAESGSSLEIYVGASVASQDLNYNLYYHSAGGNYFYYKGNTVNYATFKTSGIPLNERNSPNNANPLFINHTDGNFRLQALSPAINTGGNVSLISDYLGTVIPKEGNPDIGAYEYDVTAPILSNGSNIGNTTDPTPNFTFTTDEAGTISYSGDCSSSTISVAIGSNAVTFNALAQGTYSNCKIIVTDPAGNASDQLSISSFVIDINAPTTIASPVGNTFNTNQNVILTCNDGGGSGCDQIYYTTDGTDPTVGSSHGLSPVNLTTSSNTTFKFFAKDLAGNSESIKAEAYIIDAVAPTGGAFTINNGATHTNSSAVTLNITCPTDPWATVQMAYGDSASPINWKTCATSQAWTLPTGDGDKTIYVRFKDGGNNTTSDLTQMINLDQTAPTVSNVTSTTTDGSYKVGSTINVLVTFSENVTISGTPRIKLQTNNGNKYATYSAGTGTQNIDFTYTVQAGDTTNDLDYVDTASLELNSGTIKDAVNNNASLTLPTSGAAHSLSNNKNIVLDTTAPTISDLAPNNTTFSVTTTSTNLTLTTTETATCKYSTTSGTDYASMTAFDTTNATSHSAFISGLNTGTTYNYYILCQDTATNESTEEHLTFSVAPTENNNISLGNIKIKVGREINKFKDIIRIAKNKLKLKQEDTNLANGTVKIYKDNKRIDTIDTNADGSWDKILKLKDEFSGWIKIRQYDQFGTLLSTDKAKIKVDTEDPKFNEAIPEKMTIGRNQKIYFTATDDNSGIDFYKVKLADIRDWRQQNEDFYQIPEDVPNGTYDLFIRAYDKTGNYAEEKTTLNIVRFKNSVNLTQVPLNLDSPTQNIENQIQNHTDGNTDKNTDTTPNNSSSNNSPSSQPQAQPKTSHWWNPFSWF